MTVVYNTATTLNGYIADEQNSLSWLFDVASQEMPDHEAFLNTIGVIVSGSTTYEWVLEHENLMAEPDKWPQYYGDRPMIVFTTRQLPVPEGAAVTFLSGDVDAHWPTIEAAAGDRDVWVVGGGDLAGQFYDAGHLDQVQLSLAPVALLGGAAVLPRRMSSAALELVDAQRFDQFVHLTYAVRRANA